MKIKACDLQKAFRMYSYDYWLDNDQILNLEIRNCKLYVTFDNWPGIGFFIEGSKDE